MRSGGLFPLEVSICRGSSRPKEVCFFCFVSKEKEQVRVVREDDSGKRDVIYCDHPVELIVTLLKKLGGTASVSQLCQVTNDDDLDFCIASCRSELRKCPLQHFKQQTVLVDFQSQQLQFKEISVKRRIKLTYKCSVKCFRC